MKLIAAITLGCGIGLVFTGSILWGIVVLIIGVALLLFANRPKTKPRTQVSKDRLGGLDSFFGGS